MEYRTLGKTGLKVSRMGFGGIPIQKIDEEGTRKLLQDMVKRELCRSTEDGGDFRENRQNPEHRIPEPLPSRFPVSERNVQG